MNEDKATRYHRLGRQTGLMSTAWTCGLLFLLLFSGTSAALRSWARDIGTATVPWASDVVTVALYVLVLSVVVDLATLPFSYYRGYLLERRYGVGTETLRHWLVDHVKAIAIGLLFAEVGAGFIYAVIRQWPAYWWVVAGIGASVVTVALVMAAPVLLLPLFYTFKPLENATLRDRLTKLAVRANTSIDGVFEWTLSDRTKKANAALTGMGRTRRILLSDTLLAQYSDDEIEVILAHELAHHVYRDLWSSVVLDVVLTFVGFFAADVLLRLAVPLAGLEGLSDVAAVPVLLVAAGGLGLAVRPLLNAISRSHERRADRYALDMTKNPSAFLSAMRRLGQQNLAEEDPSPLVQMLFYTHPPIKDRLRAAREWAAATAS